MINPSARAPLGSTGITLSRMGFGSAPIGNLLSEVEEEAAQAALAAAIDDGIRFIDVAPFYGYGLAEERVGRALKGRNRADFAISTKVGRLIRPGQRSGNELFGAQQSFYIANPQMCAVFDYTYDGVLRSLADSLQRLQMDRVEILHIHDPDDAFDAAVAGAYRALDRLRSDGTISAVSVGMNQWEMLSRFIDHGRFDCFLLAGRYSLLDQTALTEFLPKCQKYGISVVAGGVFNSGLLGSPRKGATFNYLPASDAMIDRALRIQDVCQAHHADIKAAALQFPLAHPAVISVLSGVRSAHEWRENHRLMATAIPSSLWNDLKSEGLVAASAPVPD